MRLTVVFGLLVSPALIGCAGEPPFEETLPEHGPVEIRLRFEDGGTKAEESLVEDWKGDAASVREDRIVKVVHGSGHSELFLTYKGSSEAGDEMSANVKYWYDDGPRFGHFLTNFYYKGGEAVVLDIGNHQVSLRELN